MAELERTLRRAISETRAVMVDLMPPRMGEKQETEKNK